MPNSHRKTISYKIFDIVRKFVEDNSIEEDIYGYCTLPFEFKIKLNERDYLKRIKFVKSCLECKLHTSLDAYGQVWTIDFVGKYSNGIGENSLPTIYIELKKLINNF